MSLAICSFVFPSVLIPRLVAATTSGSVGDSGVGADVVGLDISFVALSNSFLARPIDFASD